MQKLFSYQKFEPFIHTHHYEIHKSFFDSTIASFSRRTYECFYDGNGRTGRIISVLYLVTNDLLYLPILYLSRYITHNKSDYYNLIQKIRDNVSNNQQDWQKWILFMLKGIEQTSKKTVILIQNIKILMDEYKIKIIDLLKKLKFFNIKECYMFIKLIFLYLFVRSRYIFSVFYICIK